MRSLKTLKCLLALGMICSTSSLVVKAEDTGVPTETEPKTGTEGTEETTSWADLVPAEKDELFETDGQKYATLAEAIEHVTYGGTITLLGNVDNAKGIAVPSGKNFIVDFDGHTYTIAGPGAGSAGTETNGFQLLKDSTITFKNGTITTSENPIKIKLLIQNYSNLILENITLDGSACDAISYVLSNNNGNTTITGDTNIIAAPNKVAFDVYFWPAGSYVNGVSVTFDDNFSGSVDGKIEVASDGTKPWEDKIDLNIDGENGDFTKADFDVQVNNSDTDKPVTISGGIFGEPVEEYVIPALNTELVSNGTYRYYSSPEEALKDAKPDDVINNITEGTTNVEVRIENGDEVITLNIATGTEITLPEAPTKNGYTFKGWSDGTTTYAASAKVTINADVTFTAVWEKDTYVPPYRPSRPTTSDDDTDVSGVTVDSEDKVDVEEVSTDRDVRDALGRDNIITTIQVEEADEPVEVTVEAGRDYKDETVYVVQKNADDELVLVTVVEADSRGDIVFVTESAEELTLTTYLPEGFIDDAEGNSYYINEDSEMVYGWLELEDGWYFFDYETGIQQKGRWVAEYTDWYCLDANGRMFTSAWIARDSKLDVWYYVNEDGLMLTNTTTPDGFYVDAEGIWRA